MPIVVVVIHTGGQASHVLNDHVGLDRVPRASRWRGCETHGADDVEAPAAGISATFPMDDFTRMRLLEGLDDIGLTLRNEADISAYESRRPSWLPTTA